MAIVRRAPHYWWVPFVSIAGAMLVTGDATASEIASKGGCGVACGITRGVSKARSAEELVFNKGLIVRFGGSNDPDDDWTSRDPKGGEPWDDLADDDESSRPVAVWLQDSDRCSFTLEAESAPAATETGFATFISRFHLRC
jgi:hypothetical protein